MQVKNLLTQMVGGTYLYRAKPHKIIGFRVVEGVVLVSTDKNLLEIELNKAEEILKNEFIQTDSEEIVVHKKNSIQTYQNLKIKEICTSLSDSIEKLKNDPGYIKQAMAINNTVNTIMGVIKTEIAAVKNMKG